MNERELLHDIVDRLPDSELITAARILTALEIPADRLQMLLANAPDDDEPFDAKDAEDEDGPSIPHGDVVRRYS